MVNLFQARPRRLNDRTAWFPPRRLNPSLDGSTNELVDLEGSTLTSTAQSRPQRLDGDGSTVRQSDGSHDGPKRRLIVVDDFDGSDLDSPTVDFDCPTAQGSTNGRR
jgi:hypothetical protein